MSNINFSIENLKVIGSNGYATIDSQNTIEINTPNFLNLNADTVAISTDVTIAGQVSSDVIIGSGYYVGIGTTNPTAELEVSGIIIANDIFAYNVIAADEIYKGSGSFRIDHPLESKKDTYHLVHSFIEGPKCDLIYRGKVDLTGGTASINIDEFFGMSEGTFSSLCRDVQCFTTNESGWDLVKGSVSNNVLTIESQNSNSNDTISWMVVGERKDPNIINAKWTDSEGRVILEPKKL